MKITGTIKTSFDPEKIAEHIEKLRGKAEKILVEVDRLEKLIHKDHEEKLEQTTVSSQDEGQGN